MLDFSDRDAAKPLGLAKSDRLKDDFCRAFLCHQMTVKVMQLYRTAPIYFALTHFPFLYLTINSIKVWCAGDLKIDWTGSFSTNRIFFDAFPRIYQGYSESRIYISNMKLWDHVVENDPEWIYNSGSGIEDALHVIYGPINDYQPNLVEDTNNPSNSGGVGYYFPGGF